MQQRRDTGRRSEAAPKRSEIERLLRDAYAARMRGDTDAVCACFAEAPHFAIAGAQQTSPIPVKVAERNAFRSLMDGLIKTFDFRDHEILSMVIDGSKAAVHWRVRVRAAPTGEEAVTEIVDVVTVENGKIASFVEFCDTALAARLMGQG